nr:hypothetical protein [Tanacetum cinerariifolium]
MRKTCVRPPQRNHHQRATNETTAKLQLNFLGRWNARISIKQADSMPKAYDANNDEDGDMQLYMVKRANLTETIIIQLEPHPCAAATSPPPPSMASFQSIISNVSEP